jgi:UDP-N-acetylmuramoyl-tripeptide--D-alanyl-D-alanine ligase
MATPIPRNAAAFTLAEVAQATAGRLVSDDGAVAVRGVVSDSRAVESGNLYVALRGERLDGHAYVAQALASGASAALVSDRARLPAGARGVVVTDTLRALGDLAALHRKRWGGRVVAITGSAGKTTTKELTFAALQAAGARVVRTAGNLNNLVGAPLTLLCLDARTEIAVIEIGTSAPGEIARLAEICAPEVGAVTAVAAAHTEGLGSVQQVAAEKAALLWALPEAGTSIYSADHDVLIAQLDRVRTQRRIAFGSSARADVQLVSHALDVTPAMRCVVRAGHGGPAIACELKLFGIGPALDATCALAIVLETLGEGALQSAARGLARVSPVPGRLAPLRGPADSLILDDSYNANPASMRSSIETALELARVRGGRALLVLGDMLELGASSRAEHEAVGRMSAQPGVAALVACGREMTAAAETAREQARRAGAELSIAHLSDPAGAAVLVAPLLRANDVVLVKGSRGVAMERVVDGLRGEGGT